MPRTATLNILAAFATALAFTGCGGQKDVANAPENVREAPASTAAPYEAEAAPATETAGQTLLESRCAVCHTLDRVKKKKLDRAGWENIIQRMKKNGAKVNDEEREALVEYLTATYGK
ncbi:MAG: hypothetical protein GTN49_00445 [candidate division Zixibacteria bacterium]|nr:hypothetical protein [candidate division Zixibacteria bacterium]